MKKKPSPAPSPRTLGEEIAARVAAIRDDPELHYKATLEGDGERDFLLNVIALKELERLQVWESLADARADASWQADYHRILMEKAHRNTREAQRLLADGVREIFERMSKLLSVADYQLFQDALVECGNLRAIARRRRERKEKPGRCHPQAVKRELNKLLSKHPEIEHAIYGARAKAEIVNVADADLLRDAPTAKWGNRYQREAKAEPSPASVTELKDILTDYVRPSELKEAVAAITAWASDM